MANSRSVCVALASSLAVACCCWSSTSALADEKSCEAKSDSSPAAAEGQQSGQTSTSPDVPTIIIPYKDHSLENLPGSVESSSSSSKTSETSSSGATESAESAGSSPAKDNSAGGTETSQASSPAGKTPMLQGGVSGTAVRIDDGLTRINLADQAAQQSCEAIMKEATRKDTIVMRGPNYIGNGIVVPALGGQGGVMQMGEMPIRRERLNRYLSESEQNIIAAQSYIDGLIIPPENAPATDAYTSLRSAMATAQEHLAQLKALSAQKRLLNKPIGRAALAVFDALTAVEKNRSELSKLLFTTSVGATGDGAATAKSETK